MTDTPTPKHYRRFPVRIRQVEVVAKKQLSPTMLRITFGGEGARGFESGIFDEHVKLIFTDPSTGELRLPQQVGDKLEWPTPKPVGREYTIRKHRPESHEFDIDFVVHGEGLAGSWAENCTIGDRLHVAGPPGGWEISRDYDFYVLAGDETGLPSMARFLEEADPGMKGTVVVEVPDKHSEIDLADHPGFTVTWVHNHGKASTVLADTVTATDIPHGASVFVWLAGEAAAIKPLRGWIKHDLQLQRGDISVTGYWKRGAEDTHEHLDRDEG
ncbi:siderophore-interacting protein [Corynebacterium mendelii]